MAKFDYKKWVTENKYGIINEQTGSMTGSMSTGSMSTGSMSTGSISYKPKTKSNRITKKNLRRVSEQIGTSSIGGGCGPCGDVDGSGEVTAQDASMVFQLYTSLIESVPCMQNVPQEGAQGILEFISGNLTGSLTCLYQSTGSDNIFTVGGNTGSVEPFADNEWNPNLSGCGNFNNLPGNIQQLACQAYFNLGNTNNPSLTMWVQGGSCCPTGSIAPTGSFAGGGMTTGSMAQGMPSMMRKRPQRRRPTRGLREVKNIIRKLIKEQGPSVAAPIGTHGSGVSTAGRYVVVRPCNHSPNGSTTIFPIMANMTIDGVAPQVGDVFFRNYSNVNLSGNGISGGQQSKWEVIETFPAADNVSTTYDRPSVSCEQPVYGSGNYTSIPGAASVGDLVYFRCAVSNQYSQTPGVSQGCLPTSTLAPFNTLEECEASGCAPGTVNDPDGDGVADMIRPKKMQAPVKDKMPMKRGATTKPSMPNRQMPMKENNLLEELKKDLKEQNNPCATLEMNFPGVMNSGPNEGQTHVEIICQQYLSPQGLTLATPGEAVLNAFIVNNNVEACCTSTSPSADPGVAPMTPTGMVTGMPGKPTNVSPVKPGKPTNVSPAKMAPQQRRMMREQVEKMQKLANIKKKK